MARPWKLPATFAGARIAYALALVAAPQRVGGAWLEADASLTGAQVALRGLAARELALAAGLLAAVRRGERALPWLSAMVASDAGDAAATLAAGDRLSKRARCATVAVAGTAAAIGIALAARG